MRLTDITAVRGESFCTIWGTTEEGQLWLDDNVDYAVWDGPVFHAEHRYAPDILLEAHLAGLTVSLDGRIADAPREAQ